MKIALTGPESTGKTTLAQALTTRFPGSAWVPEFARTYLARLPDPAAYTLADLEAIAWGQLAAETEAGKRVASGGHLFADTDLLVLLIWAEVRFGHCPAWLRTRALDPAVYHHRLLLRPDLPWAPDPLREHPDDAMRTALFARYRTTLLAANLPFTEVGGVGTAREATAAQIIQALTT